MSDLTSKSVAMLKNPAVLHLLVLVLLISQIMFGILLLSNMNRVNHSINEIETGRDVLVSINRSLDDIWKQLEQVREDAEESRSDRADRKIDAEMKALDLENERIKRLRSRP